MSDTQKEKSELEKEIEKMGNEDLTSIPYEMKFVLTVNDEEVCFADEVRYLTETFIKLVKESIEKPLENYYICIYNNFTKDNVFEFRHETY